MFVNLKNSNVRTMFVMFLFFSKNVPPITRNRLTHSVDNSSKNGISLEPKKITLHTDL